MNPKLVPSPTAGWSLCTIQVNMTAALFGMTDRSNIPPDPTR
jgi:hypothetical protein